MGESTQPGLPKAQKTIIGKPKIQNNSVQLSDFTAGKPETWKRCIGKASRNNTTASGGQMAIKFAEKSVE